ncbi:lyase family protein [Magnetospirillum molischianum]|uniref:lyase family protein n=1 Tax=Magnetospirillum molischianum TaxID=1083 RepID=UPI00030DB90A|nr:lyase family protein [Magnetospirillum molischianum]
MARHERDLLGEREVPDDVLWGIHTLRAVENFPISGRPPAPALIRAMAQVKAAAARTNRDLGFLPRPIADAILDACAELADGSLNGSIVVDALQGGGGNLAQHER